MWSIPEVGDRVYAWRPETWRGQATKVRIEGVVEEIIRPFAWLSGAIHVRMSNTGEIEHYGIDQLDKIPEG